VWATDVGGGDAVAPSRSPSDAGRPRLLCLGGGDDALVVVRQVAGRRGDLDGFAVPWSLVSRIAREPHLGHDVLSVDVAGHAPLRVHVAAHLLLRRNRAAARLLCDLATRHAAPPAPEPAPAPRPAPLPPESETRPIPT
jgi:hypothetical protein